MSKISTIQERLALFIESLNISDRRFSEAVGFSHALVGAIKRGTSFGVDKLEKILAIYPDLNVSWLLTGEGTMLNSKAKAARQPAKEEPLRTLVHTVDKSGKDNIVLVPVKAQAGYLRGIANAEYVETLPSFFLPGLNHGTFRAFEVAGYSMLFDRGVGFNPTDIVIGQYVEDINDIKDSRVYIIVNNSEEADDIVLKRCLNRLESNGVIWCKSDNRDYPMFPLRPEQIKEVWEFKRKITAQAPDPFGIYDRINDIDARVALLEQETKRLLS